MCIKSVVFIISLIPSCLFAQTINLKIKSPSVMMKTDSAIISFKMTVSECNSDSKQQITLTPLLINGSEEAELHPVILNGKLMSRIYERQQKMKERMEKRGYKTSNIPDRYPYSVFEMKNEDINVDYLNSIETKPWMYQANLFIRKDVFNTKGVKIQSEKIAVVNSDATSTLSVDTHIPDGSVESPVKPEQNSGSSAANIHYKGTFVQPVVEVADEENKKRLDFSLEEARVMAQVNPQMLSLRELYTVALSYKNSPSQFYHIIYVSVKVYPADPIANLNAASAAVEQGNISAAGRYLQIAVHGTTAYKNCRGAYELLCNNIFEGITLLKAAKAEGSEEAVQNLKVFFDKNKQLEQ